MAGQGINVCSLLAQSQPVAPVQALLLPRVCIPVLSSLPQGRRCLPKVLLLWEPLAPLAPPPNANPNLAVVDQATQGWHTGFPTLQGFLLFSAQKIGFKQFPPVSPYFPTSLPDSSCQFCDLSCCESPRCGFSPRAPATLTRHEAGVREVVPVTRVGKKQPQPLSESPEGSFPPTVSRLRFALWSMGLGWQ